MKNSGRDPWAKDLLESDRLYFEADAELIEIDGATIALMRGAESLAAGCVVQRIDAPGISAHAEEWIAGVEKRLRELGCTNSRLYVEAPDLRLDMALIQRGYSARTEFGFVHAAGPTRLNSAVELRPADDEQGWAARRHLIERCAKGPDGHEATPDLWVEMERRRCRAGYMRPYAMMVEKQVVGAVCSAPCGSLLRLKNVIVDPDWRLRGVATGAAVRFAQLAEEAGHSAAGCFAIEGEPGVAVYAAAGYQIMTQQTEWLRTMEGVPK